MLARGAGCLSGERAGVPLAAVVSTLGRNRGRYPVEGLVEASKDSEPLRQAYALGQEEGPHTHKQAVSADEQQTAPVCS